jgi:hypothetical protein
MNVIMQKGEFFQLIKENNFANDEKLIKNLVKKIERDNNIKMSLPVSNNFKRQLSSKVSSLTRSWKKLKGGIQRKTFVNRLKTETSQFFLVTENLVSNQNLLSSKATDNNFYLLGWRARRRAKQEMERVLNKIDDQLNLMGLKFGVIEIRSIADSKNKIVKYFNKK